MREGCARVIFDMFCQCLGSRHSHGGHFSPMILEVEYAEAHRPEDVVDCVLISPGLCAVSVHVHPLVLVQCLAKHPCIPPHRGEHRAACECAVYLHRLQTYVCIAERRAVTGLRFGP